MGTYYTYGASRKYIIEQILKEATYTNTLDEHSFGNSVLAHCLRGNVLWTANESHVDGKVHDRWIGCYLLNRGNGDGWGYRPMDEDMGPCYWTCPVSYLALARRCRVPSKYSLEWREKVSEYATRQRERIAKRRKLHIELKKHLTTSV